MEVADKVRKATPDDLPEISTALSRAFYNDPLFARAALHIQHLNHQARHGLPSPVHGMATSCPKSGWPARRNQHRPDEPLTPVSPAIAAFWPVLAMQ